MGQTDPITPAPSAHHQRRTTMLRKLTLGLVAAASLSALALAPSAASAKPWGGGGGWGGGWGIHHHYFDRGIGFVDVGSCYVTHRILTPYGYRLITENVCIE
jgi:hypothetical protein